jgi:hypothetical protein
MATKVKMIRVVSSNIEAIGHDEATTTLYIRFNSGKTYRYEGVTEAEYENLVGAPSISKYFSKMDIRAKGKPVADA